MKTQSWIFVLSGVFLLCLFGIGANAHAISYGYEFEVAGTATSINPLSGIDTGAVYYHYANSEGNPGHGFTADDTAYFWLYEQTGTGILSLGVIFGDPGSSGNGGTAHFTLAGLPSGWAWTVQDDPGDIGGNTDTTPTWGWVKDYTDGGVISNLETGTWDIAWTLNTLVNHSNWYFLSDDNGTITSHQFNLSTSAAAGNNVLTVSRFETQATSAVPEPSTLILTMAGLLGMASFGRRRAA